MATETPTSSVPTTTPKMAGAVTTAAPSRIADVPEIVALETVADIPEMVTEVGRTPIRDNLAPEGTVGDEVSPPTGTDEMVPTAAGPKQSDKQSLTTGIQLLQSE